MKKAMPLLNKCFAMVCGKRTSIEQRSVSYAIGAKPVIEYVSRDPMAIKQQF